MVVPKYLRVFSSNNSSVVYIYPRILASSSACGVCTAAAEVVANHAVWFPLVSLTGCLSPCLSVSSSHSTSRVWLEVESALSIHLLELIGNEWNSTPVTDVLFTITIIMKWNTIPDFPYPSILPIPGGEKTKWVNTRDYWGMCWGFLQFLVLCCMSNGKEAYDFYCAVFT